MSDEVEALIHPGDDGKFWAEVVGLPGCYAQGDNYSKIMAGLRDAHELCSLAPSPTPPPTTISLEAGATVSELLIALAPHGWSQSAEKSQIHQLLTHSPSGAQLCVPLDQDVALNSGFRATVTKYLAGSDS